MLLLYRFLRRSSKLSLAPNSSSAYVRRPMQITESMFSIRFTLLLGHRNTTMNSYSALGPSLRVILLVSSREIGFSINHDSCLNSLLTMLSLLPYPAVCGLFFYSGDPAGLLEVSIWNGRSLTSNLSAIDFLLQWKLAASIDSSTIYSKGDSFTTFRVEPRSLPGIKVPQLSTVESTVITFEISENILEPP